MSEASLSDKIWNDGAEGCHDMCYAKDVKWFVKQRIYDATRLLALFNQDKLTSSDLREHRQKIKDEAGDKLK